MVLKVVAVVARDEVAGLSAHLNGLDKVKESVVGSFQSHEAKKLGVAKEGRVEWVDVVRRKPLKNGLFSLVSTLINLLESLSFIDLPLAASL